MFIPNIPEMINRFIFFLLCFITCNNSSAQDLPDLSPYKTIGEKLKLLALRCEKLKGEEKYDAVLRMARYGLQITPAQDWDNRSRFSLYLTISENTDTAIAYARQAIQYGRLSENNQRLVNALSRILNIYTHHTGYEEQKQEVVAEMQVILDSTRDENLKATLYGPLAIHYGAIGAYEKQVNYLLSAVVLEKKQKAQGHKSAEESSNIGVSLLNIAEIYIRIGQTEKGLPYLKESRGYFGKYQNGMSHYYKSMTDAYTLLKQPQTATIYYDSLTALCSAGFIEGWSNRMALDLGFTEYFLNEKNNDKALEYVLRAKNLVTKWPDDFMLPQIDYMMGSVYAARKEYRKALPYLKASEQLCRETGLDVYAGLLQTLAQAYGGLGQWQEAYNYYSRYSPIRDSLYVEAAQKSLADAEAKYQNKEKQLQINRQGNQLAYAHKQRLWLISGLGLVALIAILLIVIYRNKKRTANVLDEKNKKLAQLNSDLEESNQTKAKLFGIISHDLRSPISQVYQFLKLQQMAPDRLDEGQRIKLSNKIHSATGSLLETMEDLLLWSKTQMNQFNTDMQTVVLNEVLEECLQLLQLNIEAKHLIVTNHLLPENVVKSDPYFLQTILRNLLQNAIKASPLQGTLLVNYKNQRLTIQNDGSYFSQQQYEQALCNKENVYSLSGLGLRLVDELSHKVNAQVSFAEPGQNTTVVCIDFPA